MGHYNIEYTDLLYTGYAISRATCPHLRISASWSPARGVPEYHLVFLQGLFSIYIELLAAGDSAYGQKN